MHERYDSTANSSVVYIPSDSHALLRKSQFLIPLCTTGVCQHAFQHLISNIPVAIAEQSSGTSVTSSESSKAYQSLTQQRHTALSTRSRVCIIVLPSRRRSAAAVHGGRHPSSLKWEVAARRTTMTLATSTFTPLPLALLDNR